MSETSGDDWVMELTQFELEDRIEDARIMAQHYEFVRSLCVAELARREAEL